MIGYGYPIASIGKVHIFWEGRKFLQDLHCIFVLQVNDCQKLLFLHQLTHNMTTDCSLNYKFNTWKFQAQTWGEHVVCRNCFWHSEQFLNTACSPHVLQKKSFWQRFTCKNRKGTVNYQWSSSSDILGSLSCPAIWQDWKYTLNFTNL